MARTLSNWEYRHLLSECQDLVGRRLEKIYETSHNTFRFDFSFGDSLVVRLGECIYRTRTPPKPPMQPSAMAMTMRKHVEGKRLAGFEQYASDRIYILHMNSGHSILIEQMSVGNLFFLDPDEKIIRPYHFQPTSAHTYMVGGKYQHPPSPQFDFPPTLQTWRAHAQDKAAATLPVFLSKWPIGKIYTNDLLARMGWTGRKVGEIGDEEASKLLQTLAERLSAPQPRIYEKINQTDNQPLAFELSLAPLVEYEKENSGFSIHSFPTWSAAIEYFFAHYKEEVKEAENQQLKGLRHRLKKQEAALQKLDEEIAEKTAETQQLETHLAALEARRLELLGGAKPKEGIEELDKDKKKWKIKIKE